MRQLQTGLQHTKKRQVFVIKYGNLKMKIKKATVEVAFLRNPMVEVVGIEPTSERSSSRESHVRLR